MKKKYKLMSGGTELLPRLEPLWLQLKEHHILMSEHFSNHLQTSDFESRMKELREKSQLRIDIVIDINMNKDIGYCVSSIDQHQTGEVDSLFVLETYRGEKLGDVLMKKALTWMDQKQVKKKIVGVLAGNDAVLKFYQKYGFYPRSITLCQKDQS